MRKGLRFLKKTQRSDGSWVPLWFGNQDRADEENPIYGTAKVLVAYAELGLADSLIAQRGVDFLVASQNEDGGWGGGQSISYRAYRQDGSKTGLSSEIGSTIEETSLALEALTRCAGDSGNNATIMRGLDWLAEAVRCGHLDCSWPIGFYFAKLWYHERLYPAIFALSALGSLARRVLH
jgi:squalene-hopene/tetraprenyl-beta-curcumene cyclase